MRQVLSDKMPDEAPNNPNLDDPPKHNDKEDGANYRQGVVQDSIADRFFMAGAWAGVCDKNDCDSRRRHIVS